MALLTEYLRNRANDDKKLADEVMSYELEMNNFKVETEERVSKLESAVESLLNDNTESEGE